MRKVSLTTRVGKAEQAITAHRTFSQECICFPKDEQPFFCSIEEEEIASKLKCPVHGSRFMQPIFHIYVSGWRRENEAARRQGLSAEYRKAWEVSFPKKEDRSEGQQSGVTV